MSHVVVLPGDSAPIASTSSAGVVYELGPGIRGDGSKFVCTRSGLFGTHSNHESAGQKKRKKDKQQVWIESRSKRYVVSAHEPVIGTVQVRHAEGYRCDLGTSTFANLDALAFEGATKRSKPNLKVGSIVYGHVLPTPPFSEPEIACVDMATQKSAGYGQLEGGFLIRDVELSQCRSLLVPGNETLARIAKGGPFEVAVGMNGRVWIKVPDGDEERMPDIIKMIMNQ